MVADITSFSPSAGKPREVIASWENLSIPLEIIEPTPVSKEQLYLVHDKNFVDSILSGKSDNGFGSRSMDVANSLPWTCGSVLSAARKAIENRCVAVSPSSGFHHSSHSSAHGFCTFNGLMVTAASLISEGVSKVGILDCDMHWGDGTQSLIDELPIGNCVIHFSAGKNWYHPRQAGAFLKMLPSLVAAFDGCSVLLYQAGVDCHIDDPLGGWLTTEQIYKRDLIVFQTAKRIHLPIIYTLAGGYMHPLRRLLDLHDNTLRACSSIYLN